LFCTILFYSSLKVLGVALIGLLLFYLLSPSFALFSRRCLVELKIDDKPRQYKGYQNKEKFTSEDPGTMEENETTTTTITEKPPENIIGELIVDF